MGPPKAVPYQPQPERQSGPLVGVLRRPEAAKYVGLSIPAFDRIIYAGEGPRFVRLTGRSKGYRPADLDHWIASRLGDEQPA